MVKPIEKKVSELENLKKITSRIDDGVAVINVEYKYESEVEEKYQELVREINAIRTELPQDIYSIEVRKVAPSDVNVIQVALVSENASNERMKFYAEELKEDLEKVKSLKKVEYWGVPEQIVRIDLKLDKIAQQHIPVNYVIGSIQSEAANIPGGNVRAGTKTFNVKTSGKYKSLEEIQNTIVYNSNGNIVYLKDVADIGFNNEEEKHITRLNGNRCVLVTAAQKPGENIAETQKEYLPVIEAFQTKITCEY